MRKRILFVCTHNSARSQMAEGYMRAKYGDRYEVFSGGTEVTRVHPMAIAVMQEIGIDISGHRSKLIDEFFGMGIETVVTVCDAANKACPFFPLWQFVDFTWMSKKVIRRIKINIGLSMVYNAFGLLLGVQALLSPITATLYQEAGCISVVLSSILLLWAKPDFSHVTGTE